jgi:hypothetical protein
MSGWRSGTLRHWKLGQSVGVQRQRWLTIGRQGVERTVVFVERVDFAAYETGSRASNVPGGVCVS